MHFVDQTGLLMLMRLSLELGKYDHSHSMTGALLESKYWYISHKKILFTTFTRLNIFPLLPDIYSTIRYVEKSM